MFRLIGPALLLALAAPLAARDSLGVFDQWGAFRDPQVPRCYAIAAAEPDDDAPAQAFASIGTWPRRDTRGQVYFRLSRPLADGAAAILYISGNHFDLTGRGNNAWAADRTMDAAIIAAMRSAAAMQLRGRGADGRRFTDRYSLAGSTTAMDAATIGCASVR